MFDTFTGPQLCEILQDGEIMSYINKIPIKKEELATLFTQIGTACSPKTTILPIDRTKKMRALVKQLATLIQYWEKNKETNISGNARPITNAELRRQAAANAVPSPAPSANVNTNERPITQAELRRQAEANSLAAMGQQSNIMNKLKNSVSKLKMNIEKMEADIQQASSVSAAAAGGRRKTRKGRKGKKTTRKQSK
jgi:hypothetical protein